MQQIYPALRPCDVSEVYSGVAAERPSSRVLMNVVTTADGRAAVGGRSSTIGSETDRVLMRQLRSVADAVVVGTGTLRSEGVFTGLPRSYQAERVRAGLTPQPLTVLLGGRGEIPLRGRLASLGAERLVVFLPRDADAAPLRGHATLHAYDGARAEPSEVLRTLEREHGVRTVLIEGGPSVYGSFVRAGLVEEVFWTLAPKLAGGAAPGMLEGPELSSAPEVLRLVSVHEHRGELYLRYKRGAEPGPD
jgi:riboflavin biosynthesis pyrimidine reductase